MREKKAKDVSFIGLDGFCFTCTLQAWCNVGARLGGRQVGNAQKLRMWRKESLASVSLSVKNSLQMARPIGSLGKVGCILKEAILTSFEAVGGARYLEEIARTDPRTYCSLISKVIPKPSPFGQKEAQEVAVLSDSDLQRRVAAMIQSGDLATSTVDSWQAIDAEEVGVKR